MPTKFPFVVGLTGGIGSGKSTVANLFATHGVATLDVDLISRQLTHAHGAAMPTIRAAFGDSVIEADGGLNRKIMRELTFGDAAHRLRLQEILHPMIFDEMQAQLNHIDLRVAYAMVSVPLLFETAQFRHRFDRILVIDCDENTQRKRVMQRSGLSAAMVENIMDTQWSRQMRKQNADDIIMNQGASAELTPQVEVLHRRYLYLAKSGG